MEPATAQLTENYSHFVTLTLKPELYGKSCRQQLRSTFNKANFELQRVCKHYYLVAELTKKCNIHYHAKVEFDISEFFTADDLSLILQDNLKTSNVFGRSECEPIKSQELINKYIIKDIEKTHKIINPRGKTTLDCKKEWTKGLTQVTVKNTRLKDYLVLDKDIQYSEEELMDSINYINFNIKK